MGDSSQFSGPAAFWCLVVLAFNVMLQPSGKPCHFHFRCRTYLRTIPLVCAADSISIWIRFLTYLILVGIPFREAAAMVLEFRYRCCKYCDTSLSEETLQNLEKNSYVRWLVFIFGTLPSSIKVFAVTGIPWTTAWAVMYLFLWGTVECMILAADKHPGFPPTSDVYRIPETVERLRLRRVEKLDRRYSIFHQFLGNSARTSSEQVVFYGCLDLLFEPPRSDYPFELLAISFMPYLLPVCKWLLPRLMWRVSQRLLRFLLPFITFSVVILVIFLIILMGTSEFHDFMFKFYIILCLFTVVRILLGLTIRSSRGRTIVFFLNPKFIVGVQEEVDEKKVKEEVEKEAMSSLLYFLWLLTIGGVWYYVRYDPKDTTKPVFTEWLG